MERPYTGLSALIKVNQSKVAYLNSLELNLEKDIIEILQFGAEYREKMPAIKNWTASVEGTVAFAPGESQHKLYQAYESGELITLEIALNENTMFVGQALVSSMSISGAPDDALNLSAEFEGSGATVLTLPQSFIITISSGVGGSTNPAGQVRVLADGTLEITCLPAVGKKASKYYLDATYNDAEGKWSTEGTEITSNKFSLESISAEHTVFVEFADADGE